MKKSLKDQPSRPQVRPVSAQRGFALIVTVTIMILLSLIAVGILSLSTTTLRSSSNSGAVQEARANARIAMNIALGELQRLAGPDQRITATANIAGDDEGEELAAGADPENNNSLDGTQKGLTATQMGTRHWTGVFINNDDPSLIYSKTPSATLQGWLISNPTSEVQDGTSSVNPGNTAYSASPDGTATNPEQAIVLVGNNTFGNRNTGGDNFVSAPLVRIFDGDNQTGSYAWWVGDEGVKSRINESNEDPQEESFASLSAQRRGWEVVDGVDGYPEAGDERQETLERLVTTASSELLIGDINSTISGTESLFHAATTHSVGLHTNAFEGGFKVDLTTALEDNFPPAEGGNTFDNYPDSDTAIIPADATDTPLDLLTWEHLASFYEKVKEGDDELTVGVDTTASNGTNYAIAPLISQIRLVLGARVASARGSASMVNVNPCGKIAIVLANPYSQTLSWNDDLELQFRHMNGDLGGDISSRLWNRRRTTAFFPRDETADSSGSEASVFGDFIFNIGADSLPPGQARVYTLGAPVRRGGRGGGTTADLVADVGDLDDFRNCVELAPTETFDLPQNLDVREQTCTSLIQLTMSQGGNVLRQVSGLELNNIDFRNTAKIWREAVPNPVPLQTYRFEISKPGVDYESNFLNGGEAGNRASALRTYTDFNLQANHFETPISSFTPPPFFYRNITSASQVAGTDPSEAAASTGSGFSENLFADPIPWGYSNTNGSAETVLFTIPKALSSIAQLQHLDMTNDDTKVSVAHQPGYAVGNSYATPFVQRSLTSQARNDYRVTGFGTGTSEPRNYYDISYLLNASLWDRFFFSTMDDSPEAPLDPNQTVLSESEVDSATPSDIAGNLVYRGMFNVNSTSISAWKAFLASSKDVLNQNQGNDKTISFPRSLQQLQVAEDDTTFEDEDSWAGSRLLSDAEIDSLAREIVTQVRRRGPFVSFSQFVNRTIADAAAEPDVSRSGPLQQALEDSNININPDERTSDFRGVDLDSERSAFAFTGRNPTEELVIRNPNGSNPPRSAGRDPDWAAQASDQNYKSLSSIVADRTLVSSRGGFDDEFGSRFSGIPGWVNQADVLQALGPSMSVRSDTFRIRACGRSNDANGNILAVAYAEAIVQRSPDFVDPSDENSTNVDNLNATNQRYGRRFDIVSFRWLKENEI